MKIIKFGLLLILALLLAGPAVRAEFSQSDHVLQISLGGTTGANRYYDELAAAGIDWGAAYRFYAFENNKISIGAEISRTSYEDQPAVEHYDRVDITLLSGGAFVRYDFNPASEFLTYLSGGLLALDFTKDYTTPTGNSTDNTTRGGYFFGFGFDMPLAEVWRLGAEIRTIGDSSYFVEAVTGKLTLSYVWSPL